MTKLISIFILFMPLLATYASNKSICHEQSDSRLLSDRTFVGRSYANKSDLAPGCTVTLISDRCAITAGHCYTYLNFVEFNVPLSDINGVLSHSLESDLYAVDQSTIKYLNKGLGKDYAVFSLLPNQETGLLPGQVQGHGEVSLNPLILLSNRRISLYGYGKSKQLELNGVQKISHGSIQREALINVIFHNVDSTGGDSGAAVFDDKSDKIIGIHHAGSCRQGENDNVAVVIARTPQLVTWIRQCLAR